MPSRGNTQKDVQFKSVALPTGVHSFVPTNLNILIPKAPRINPEDRHYLAYLPWEHKYLAHIPSAYHEFFKFVLPFLHARTSNVHTALSTAQLPYLLKNRTGEVNERIIYLALILHDCGWSQVTQQGLLMSLNYNGVAPTSSECVKPKQQHLIYGEALAYKLLDAFDFGGAPLSSDEIYAISEMIRRHDHDAAWEQGKYGPISAEIQILCDSDRLWSYTHENFWLDTIRKDVPPESYLKNMTDEISTYFFTEEGRTRALQLIDERKVEVDSYASLLQDSDKRAELILKTRHPSRRLLFRTRQLVLSAKSRRLQRSLIRQNAY